MENTAAGAWIQLPVAVDEDEALNGAIRYSIKTDDESKNWTKYFRLLNNLKTLPSVSSVKPTSRTTENTYYPANSNTAYYNGPGLLLLQPLDRETTSDFTMTLVATDLGQPTQRSGMIHLQISVLDENDNPPVFEKTDYYAEVNENEAGITLLYVCANDSDADNNGRVAYQMQPSASPNPVGLEFLRTHIQLIPSSNSVAIRISQPLDFEKQPQFEFALLAVDQGRSALSATATVHVTVRNVNDQAPVIRFYLHGEPLDKDYARLIISEHLTVNGTHFQEKLLCHVHVVDNDSNMSEVECNVESVDRKFMLREVSVNQLVQRKKIYELLSVIHLDRETATRYLIIVRCQDGLMPNRLVSHKQLQLIISDVNDNDPQFEQDHYHGYVYENAANAIISLNTFDSKPQQTIVKNALHATDRDAGQNALIHYVITPWTGHEQLKEIIRGNIPQNYTDYGTVPMTNGVKVRDENDNPPVLGQRHYSFKISEAHPRHSRVGQINSTDADISPENRLTVYALRDNAQTNASEFLFIEAYVYSIKNH
ncbi:protocadherin delta 1 [Paragonimus westermani]|uniref:Protocadherin delta 1 n=1 Tax=Paragonimus westermani TaxID=34504 RepID=A0A5J4NUV6_9TREM|nr:protocadherin delta 1 [Paragonimus westermani]